MEKPIIYIAGPISNMPGLNRVSFAATTKFLRDLGHIVINPHELCNGIEANEWQKCMRVCLSKLTANAELVVMLEGWQQSKGATIEYNIAQQLGVPTISITEFILNHEKN